MSAYKTNNTVNGAGAAVSDGHWINSADEISPVNGLPFYRPTPADITINNRKEGDKPKILFKNVNIFDSTGADPYPGDVLIEGERIAAVGEVDAVPDANTLVIDGKGKKTLMSGLVDAHTHLSWNDAPTLDSLTSLPLEEHVLFTANSAKIYLDCGYTMCFGAASARPRLDIAIKNAIKSGMIPGPRTLSNAQEIATTGGAIVPNISRYADGADAMRRVVRENIDLGVDNIKLSMTGDYVTETMGSEETYYTLAETKAAVEEAHNRGKRVCSHARSAASVKMSCLAGIDVIYHASYVDAEGMDMLEALKDRVYVAPAINFPLLSCSGEATPFGLTPEMAKKKGLVHETEIACMAMNELRRRGVKVMPGGDYGFAWAPHGTYARDLAHFVNLFGYTPKETLIIATALGGELMGHPEELGKVLPGYFADLILVDGNPLENIEIFQDISKLHAIVINGHVHKNVGNTSPDAQIPEEVKSHPPLASRKTNGGS
ncbi:composite domain of metallo-dependent hydrolase [Xylariaceae sp. FL0662B]|nr:composite domain of metallo-dependent hydrolase [Xylariaceae sp. FL0662B]